MDKRYQVFISSTFLDLKEERQAVSQALLRSDCFPAQMENWPAMDAEQMEAIKQIIDESDYYVVISAGKYGSISPETGLSYTEMEYDYAVETGKPIIRLLHKDPFNQLSGKQIESKAGVRKKLEAFHKKMKATSVCSFWENPDQLKNETTLGLLDIIKRRPSTGWVRANGKANAEALLELADTKLQLADLKLSISNSPLELPLLSNEQIAIQKALEIGKEAIKVLKKILPRYPVLSERDMRVLVVDILSRLTHDSSKSTNEFHDAIELARRPKTTMFTISQSSRHESLDILSTQKFLDFLVSYNVLIQRDNTYFAGIEAQAVLIALRSESVLVSKTPPQSAP